MVVAQLHLPVNSVKSVLGCTIRSVNSRARGRSENCAKESDENSVATLNMYGNWLRMLQDDDPPKSSWRPRKSTKSWHQLSVQKFTKVTQSRKKVHRVGKLVLPSLVAWRARTKIRDAPAEKRRESKVQRRSTRTEMLFLWCFSAPCWERILAASGAHCTIVSRIML